MLDTIEDLLKIDNEELLDKNSYLDSLPIDSILKTLSFMEFDDIINTCRVNKYINRVCKNYKYDLVKYILENNYGFTNVPISQPEASLYEKILSYIITIKSLTNDQTFYDVLKTAQSFTRMDGELELKRLLEKTIEDIKRSQESTKEKFLHAVRYNPHINIINSLYKKIINPETLIKQSLRDAIKYRSLDTLKVVKYLVEKMSLISNFDLFLNNKRDELDFKVNTILNSIQRGNLDIIKYLISIWGGNPDDRLYLHPSLLDATALGHFNVFKYLFNILIKYSENGFYNCGCYNCVRYGSYTYDKNARKTKTLNMSDLLNEIIDEADRPIGIREFGLDYSRSNIIRLQIEDLGLDIDIIKGGRDEIKNYCKKLLESSILDPFTYVDNFFD